MKSKYLVLFMSVVLIAFMLPFQSFAQAPDTLDVPFMIDNNPLGAINKFILGDTTVTGERNNINRVYRLGRGNIYMFDSRMDVYFPLNLIAEDDDPANPTSPPVLARGILADGSAPGVLVRVYKGDATFKNLYFMSIRPDQSPAGWTTAIQLQADSAKTFVDHCVFDGWTSSINKNCIRPSVTVTNCVFRNGIQPTSWFGGNGGFYSNTTPTDSVILVNNTFFNCGSYFFVPNREICNYVRIDHNTIFTNHVNIFYAPYVSNAFYSNNIFYGVTAMGQRQVEIDGGWFDWDGELSAIFSIDTIAADVATREGITEADRIVHVENNAYFWPQQMVDFWANADTLTAPQWINARTQAMLDDDANYPGLLVANNLNVDPGFNAAMMSQVDSVMKYVIKLRDGTQTDYRHYFYAGPGVPLFPPTWPLPEDLTYSNTDLMTAGSDGLPLGDLNWYPDKKAQWEALQVGVELEGNESLPVDFSLSQNFPNPFNPVTSIKFGLKKAEQVKLAVYNMLGQKVRTLVDKKQQAGYHTVSWNGLNDAGTKLSSGIYYYRLETDSFSATKKMLLLK